MGSGKVGNRKTGRSIGKKAKISGTAEGYLLMLRTKFSGYLETAFSEAANASFQYSEQLAA